ncbi:MAG: peptidylprolyl isomerase [Flavobacteriales bacterium]|nr:peptidylprolyl isomerase [Flavobacteriales bacterium]MBL6873500.1 peptidylprolyl isomerase [Flavobacteriales bacterium]
MKRNSILIALCLLSFLGNSQNSVEGIVAVVGNKVILKSAVETQYLQMRQSAVVGEEAKCQILDEMMFQKLLSHHAEVDSLEVSEDEVDKAIEQRIDFFVSQIGSIQKLEAYFGKTISELREEFQTLFREQILGQRMESKVTSGVKATPKDVLQFYNRIPEDSLPIFPEEIYLSQLVVFPKVDTKERERITNKLNGFKQRIKDGEDFAFLASLYSDDPGSAKLGGDLGFVKKGKLVPKFESVAFRLQEDELSEIVETKFGFHLIQMVKRRGEQFKIRHILIKPKISTQAIINAKSTLDSLINLMDSDTLSFEQLAVRYSEDESKNNGGVMVNPQTGSSSFVLKELDASVSSTIDGLSQTEMSKPTVFETFDGRKACRVIHVDRIIEEHKANLKEDYDRIQSVALQELKAIALQNWKKEKIEETYIDIKDDFDCVWSDNWKKK